MGRLVDADRLKAHYCWWAGGSKEMSIDEAKKIFDTIIDVQPTVDAVPTDFHDRCMEIEIQKRFDLELNSEPVRHGYWTPYEFGNYRWHKCSVCGNADEYINEQGLEAIRNYCPTCGAKMDETEERLVMPPADGSTIKIGKMDEVEDG